MQLDFSSILGEQGKFSLLPCKSFRNFENCQLKSLCTNMGLFLNHHFFLTFNFVRHIGSPILIETLDLDFSRLLNFFSPAFLI